MAAGNASHPIRLDLLTLSKGGGLDWKPQTDHEPGALHSMCNPASTATGTTGCLTTHINPMAAAPDAIANRTRFTFVGYRPSRHVGVVWGVLKTQYLRHLNARQGTRRNWPPALSSASTTGFMPSPSRTCSAFPAQSGLPFVWHLALHPVQICRVYTTQQRDPHRSWGTGHAFRNPRR